MSLEKVVIAPEKGLGDAIMLTGVIDSIHRTCPNMPINLLLSRDMQRTFIRGRELEENSPIAQIEVIDKENAHNFNSGELYINLKGYLTRRASVIGDETLLQSQISFAEKQFRDQGYEITLERNVDPRIRFDNVPEYAEEIEDGKAKLEGLMRLNKPIIWLGTCSAGSKNRMPQSYEPLENFWGDLVRKLQDRATFYHFRGPNDPPIPGTESNGNQNFGFPTSSEIIKGSAFGITINGMQMEFAHALGKSDMVVLSGPTHPGALVHPSARHKMKVIPSAKEVSKKNYTHCFGCGQLGYSYDSDFKLKIMDERVPGFKADRVVGCRFLNPGEQRYDCWKHLSVDKVVEALELFL